MIIFKNLKTFNNLIRNAKYFFSETNIPKKVVPPIPLIKQFTQLKNQQKKVQTSGRSWRIEELRIKSNQDLHKLWYVCLKQKNLLYADQILKTKIQKQSSFKNPRLGKVKVTMARILTVMKERQNVRQQYRRKLQQEYVQKKKQQLIDQTKNLNDPDVPELNWKLIKDKYRDLRKGIDNVAYIQRQSKQDNERKMFKQRMNEKFKNPVPEFTSYFQKQIAQGNLKPSQQQILRSHVKNWRQLSLKQRRIILGFINAKRSKDAKKQFMKELKLLGQKIAHQQSKNRINSQQK